MSAQSRIIIFAGKGGVGKTTLSLSLGLKCAAQGKRVVVVSSHPLPELALAVSLDGLGEQHPTAAQNLFIVHLDPKELLAKVVEENFPAEWLARAVLRSTIYNNLIEVAPGLKEFYFLARLQQLAERKGSSAESGAVDYDLLIWDAPSTGHFLGTLRAARNFETQLSGPLAAMGGEVRRFFSNASGIVLVPVTTLEEMATEETVEMCGALERDFTLKAAALVLNLVSPLVEANETELQEVKSAAEASSDPALEFALHRGLTERARASALGTAIPVEAVAVQRVRAWRTDLELLDQISHSLQKLAVL